MRMASLTDASQPATPAYNRCLVNERLKSRPGRVAHRFQMSTTRYLRAGASCLDRRHRHARKPSAAMASSMRVEGSGTGAAR